MLSGASIGTLGHERRQHLSKRGVRENGHAAPVCQSHNQKMKVVQSCSAPSPISIQNYCTLGTITSTTCIGIFVGKEVEGKNQKQSYYLTQPAEREPQKSDHKTKKRPELIL